MITASMFADEDGEDGEVCEETTLVVPGVFISRYWQSGVFFKKRECYDLELDVRVTRRI